MMLGVLFTHGECGHDAWCVVAESIGRHHQEALSRQNWEISSGAVTPLFPSVIYTYTYISYICVC